MGGDSTNNAQDKSLKILFISPDNAIWSEIREGLTTYGHSVVWCKTVEDSFFVCLKQSFDHVICLDILEDATALEALKIIRKIEANERTPFLGLLHQYNPALSTELIVAGADDLIAMPFNVPAINGILCARQKRIEAFIAFGGNKEQRRIAKELHDGLQQRLIEAKFTLLGLLKAYEPRQEVKSGINHVIDTLSLAVEDSRSLAFNQLPPILEKLGLQMALKQLAESIRGENLPMVTFKGEKLEELNPQISLMLYRTAQEGISNALKYAQASQIEICVRLPEEDWVGVCIKDNGVGFELNRILTGNGLINMQNRINSLGGSLHIKSQPGAGTELFALVPMHAHAEVKK